MSEILSNIVVETNNINIVPNNNNINVTPEAIQLYISTSSGPGAGTSNNGELLYNNVNIIGGVANTSYANGNLSLGNIANVKISGGNNTYFLQTDGTGNLTWAAGAGNITGNGVPGGANTQIQFNDGGANFGGATGFSFDKVSNLVNMPGDLAVVGNITGNVQTAFTAGTVTTNAQPNITSVGTLTSLTVNGFSTLSDISNVKINGGSNGQVITTNGNGDLSFSTAVTAFTSVANIAVNNMFLGKLVLSSLITSPAAGDTITTNNSSNLSNWQTSVSGIFSSVNGIGVTTYAAPYTAANVLYYSTTGVGWPTTATPLPPTKAPVAGNAKMVIFNTNTNKAAYSNLAFGSTWSNATLPNSGQWTDLAYGNGTFIMTTRQAAYNYIAKSTDDGVTWSQVFLGGGANPTWLSVAYGNNKFMISPQTNVSNTKITTDNGTTWTNTNLNVGVRKTVYGNGTWVAMKGNDFGGNAAVYYSVNDGGTWNTGTIANRAWLDMIYADPYFIVTEGLGSNVIGYSTDGNTWSYGNASIAGGVIGQNSTYKQLFIADAAGVTSAVSINQPITIVIDNAAGGGYTQTAPNGTYRNLGGATGNVGALWIRTA